MTADVNQFPELDKTRFEQRGTEFKLKIPVTNAVSIGNSIAVGFGDGTVRIFSSGQSSEPIKAHDGVVLCMSTDGTGEVVGVTVVVSAATITITIVAVQGTASSRFVYTILSYKRNKIKKNNMIYHHNIHNNNLLGLFAGVYK